MDYKEKYEAALERAKHIHEVINDVGKKDIETIFPELFESEDERTRKSLLAYIKGESKRLDTKKWIAYLEKQKEPEWCHHKVDLSDCSEEYRKAYYDGWNNCNQQHSQLQAEQKPAEWSEEEKRAIDRACVALRAYSNGDLPEFLPSELLGYADRLQSLRPVKQDWSEEDEENFKWFDKLFRAESVVIGGKDIPQDKYLWFKSLRPQPRKEIYHAAKLDLAIRFLNYLDENRPEGKRSLSNGECEDVVRAFKENDWAKILRYAEKYGKEN